MGYKNDFCKDQCSDTPAKDINDCVRKKKCMGVYVQRS